MSSISIEICHLKKRQTNKNFIFFCINFFNKDKNHLRFTKQFSPQKRRSLPGFPQEMKREKTFSVCNPLGLCNIFDIFWHLTAFKIYKPIAV